MVLRPRSSQVLRWRAVAHLPGNLALPSLRISSEHLQVCPVATWYFFPITQFCSLPDIGCG